MPNDKKKNNCKLRRRELLAQLKCILDAINRNNPIEPDKLLSSPPKKICRDVPLQRNSFQHYIPVKDTKSMSLRGGVIYKCQCIRRNGLQDKCMLLDCMGRPECMTRSYPMCKPGQKALSKFTDYENVNVALEKFIVADKARKSALAHYCKLAGSEVNKDDIERLPPSFITPQSSLSTSLSPKKSTIQLKHQRIDNHQQNPNLQKPYAPMQGVQQLYQKPIYQQPMNYSHTQAHHHQHQHHFYPQNFAYPISFMNNQPNYPPHQEHPMNQQYQFRMPTQFVQQYPHPHPPPNLPYIQNNFLPC